MLRRLAMLVLVSAPLACGSGAPAGGGTADDRIGTVDLTQAPSSLAMTCDGGVTLALQMPCLIGRDLTGGDPNAAGVHATECRLASSSQPLVWSFLFPLAEVRADPSAPLDAPAELPSAGTSDAIDLAGQTARMSSVAGQLTFSRVDPSARAFIGAFAGTVVWTGQDATQTSCQMDGPFWGAPGDFL